MQSETMRRNARLVNEEVWIGSMHVGNRANYHIVRPVHQGDRMHASVSAPTLGPDMRRVSEGSGRDGRVQRMQRRRLFREEVSMLGADGIRASLAYAIMIVALLILVVTFSIGRYQVIRENMANGVMEAKLNETAQQCVILTGKLKAAEEEVAVGYQAVDLGLVSNNGANKIELYAPADAVLGPSR